MTTLNALRQRIKWSCSVTSSQSPANRAMGHAGWRLFLAMSDLSSHTALLSADLAASFSCLLSAHALTPG